MIAAVVGGVLVLAVVLDRALWLALDLVVGRSRKRRLGKWLHLMIVLVPFVAFAGHGGGGGHGGSGGCGGGGFHSGGHSSGGGGGHSSSFSHSSGGSSHSSGGFSSHSSGGSSHASGGGSVSHSSHSSGGSVATHSSGHAPGHGAGRVATGGDARGSRGGADVPSSDRGLGGHDAGRTDTHSTHHTDVGGLGDGHSAGRTDHHVRAGDHGHVVKVHRRHHHEHGEGIGLEIDWELDGVYDDFDVDCDDVIARAANADDVSAAVNAELDAADQAARNPSPEAPTAVDDDPPDQPADPYAHAPATNDTPSHAPGTIDPNDPAPDIRAEDNITLAGDDPTLLISTCHDLVDDPVSQSADEEPVPADAYATPGEANCDDDSHVVGYRRCTPFAKWDVESHPKFEIEAGSTMHSFDDRLGTLSGKTFSVVGPMSGHDLAITFAMRTSLTFSHVNLGAEFELGGLATQATPMTTGDAQAVSAVVASGVGFVGYRTDIGRLRIGGELAGGARVVTYGVHSPEGEDASQSVGGGIVELRARAQYWLHPYFGIGLSVGKSVMSADEWSAGVGLITSMRAFGGN